MRSLILQTVKQVPQVAKYLSLDAVRYIKGITLSRDEIERRLARSISAVDREYLNRLKQADLAQAIASPIRSQIESSMAERDDNLGIIDGAESAARIDKIVTAAIASIVARISQNTQSLYMDLVNQGVPRFELIERIALRFSSGHAEQVAVTELTRSDGVFSDVLSDMLGELGVSTQRRLTTSVDERVCPICGPADNKLSDAPIKTATGGWNGQTWGERFGNVPFHINCRCKVRVETVKG
jgi:hypothetical protein